MPLIEMDRRQALVIAVVAFGLGAGGGFALGNFFRPFHGNNYEFLNSAGGGMYRVNTSTGEVLYCRGDAPCTTVQPAAETSSISTSSTVASVVAPPSKTKCIESFGTMRAIPNVGIVSFPCSLSEAEIQAAIAEETAKAASVTSSDPLSQEFECEDIFRRVPGFGEFMFPCSMTEAEIDAALEMAIVEERDKVLRQR